MRVELEKLQALQKDLTEQIEQASAGRQDNADRVQLVKKLAESEGLNRKYRSELDQFKEFDPDLFDARKAELKTLKESANRWTDNVFSLQSYCSNQYNIGRADFNSQFGVPEDLDYVE